MTDHIVRSDIIFHDIPDMESDALVPAIIRIAEHMAPEEQRGDLAAALNSPDNAKRQKTAASILSGILGNPRADTDFIRGLQCLGAAFSGARSLDADPPEGYTQSRWNRALRDQGERLRAASLTLGAGRANVAALQLEGVRQFIEKHFSDLPG